MGARKDSSRPMPTQTAKPTARCVRSSVVASSNCGRRGAAAAAAARWRLQGRMCARPCLSAAVSLPPSRSSARQPSRRLPTNRTTARQRQHPPAAAVSAPAPPRPPAPAGPSCCPARPAWRLAAAIRHARGSGTSRGDGGGGGWAVGGCTGAAAGRRRALRSSSTPAGAITRAGAGQEAPAERRSSVLERLGQGLAYQLIQAGCLQCDCLQRRKSHE